MAKPNIEAQRLRKVLLALVPCEGTNMHNVVLAVQCIYSIGVVEVLGGLTALITEGRLAYSNPTMGDIYRVPSDE